MGIQKGGDVGQGQTLGQFGAQDVGAFNPVGTGTGPVGVGIENTATQNINPTATASGHQDQDQTGTQRAYGGDAIGGDVTGQGGNVVVND